MIYGILDLSANSRIEASPRAKAFCPICKTPLIAKCGEIYRWHFAHRSVEDCDSWHEGETRWHIDWKKLFKPEEQEVVIGSHRADIKLGNTVLEFQHSPLEPSAIRDRESFYNPMLWIFDCSTWPKFTWFAVESLDRSRFYIEFFFNRRPTWNASTRDCLFHPGGEELIWANRKAIDWDQGYGYGSYLSRPTFINRCRKNIFSKPLDNVLTKEVDSAEESTQELTPDRNQSV